jgi:hypothetical protein
VAIDLLENAITARPDAYAAAGGLLVPTLTTPLELLGGSRDGVI